MRFLWYFLRTHLSRITSTKWRIRTPQLRFESMARKPGEVRFEVRRIPRISRTDSNRFEPARTRTDFGPHQGRGWVYIRRRVIASIDHGLGASSEVIWTAPY